MLVVQQKELQVCDASLNLMLYSVMADAEQLDKQDKSVQQKGDDTLIASDASTVSVGDIEVDDADVNSAEIACGMLIPFIHLTCALAEPTLVLLLKIWCECGSQSIVIVGILPCTATVWGS